MAHDALGAHARDELGISETFRPRPLQAAFASAGSFAAGALLLLLVVVTAPEQYLIPSVSLASLVFLALLGVIAAKIARANVLKSVMRVTFWSVLAMTVTAAIGAFVGRVV